MRIHAEIQGEPNSTVSPIPPVTSLSNILPVSNTAASASSSQSGASGTSSQHEKTRTPFRLSLEIPVSKVWSGGKDEENVTVSLPRLARYFQANNVPVEDMPYQVLDFLSGKAFTLWKLESESLEASGTLTWANFATCLKRGFGVLDPERYARQQFDSLRQTHSTFSYITEIKML